MLDRDVSVAVDEVEASPSEISSLLSIRRGAPEDGSPVNGSGGGSHGGNSSARISGIQSAALMEDKEFFLDPKPVECGN